MVAPWDFQVIRWKYNGQTTGYLCSTQLLYSDRFVINFALQGVFSGSWTFAFSFPDHTDCVFWTLRCKWLLWNKCQTVRQRATMSPTKMARQLPGNRRVSCRDGRKITMLINWNSLKIGQCTYKLSKHFFTNLPYSQRNCLHFPENLIIYYYKKYFTVTTGRINEYSVNFRTRNKNNMINFSLLCWLSGASMQWTEN